MRRWQRVRLTNRVALDCWRWPSSNSPTRQRGRRPDVRVLGQRIEVAQWTDRAQLAGFMALLGPVGWRYHSEVRVPNEHTLDDLLLCL